MPKCVGQRQVSSELGNQTKPQQCQKGPAIRDAQRHAQNQRERKHENGAGKNCEAQKVQRTCVRANLFGCEKIDSEERRSSKRQRVSQSKLCVSCKVSAHDHERSGNSQCQTNPERSVRPPTKNKPRQKSNGDRSVIAEQRGIRCVCLKNGSVIKREIERKEKSADGDDRVAAPAEFLASSGEHPSRKQHNRWNQQAIERRRGPGHRGPPHKNCGPRDAGYSDDESGIRPLFAASEFVHEIIST